MQLYISENSYPPCLPEMNYKNKTKNREKTEKYLNFFIYYL